MLPRYDIARALAASERRLVLCPDDPAVQLEYGLLLYFKGDFEEAWQELALYKEQCTARGEPVDLGLDVVLTKLRLLTDVGLVDPTRSMLVSLGEAMN